jgi:hypothetical protein
MIGQAKHFARKLPMTSPQNQPTMAGDALSRPVAGTYHQSDHREGHS